MSDCCYMKAHCRSQPISRAVDLQFPQIWAVFESAIPMYRAVHLLRVLPLYSAHLDSYLAGYRIKWWNATFLDVSSPPVRTLLSNVSKGFLYGLSIRTYSNQWR